MKELKDSISGTYRLKTEERRRTMKNGEESPQNRSRKRLKSVTEAPRLGFFSRNQFFSLISREFSIPEGLNLFCSALFPLFIGENREVAAAQLA